MSTREQELESKIHELEGEILRYKLAEADKIRLWRKEMFQMILTAISPLLIAFVGYLGWQTNSKLDEANTNRERIEHKIDEAKETTETVAVEARKAVEKAETTAHKVTVGTEAIKTAVANLRNQMDDGTDAAPEPDPE